MKKFFGEFKAFITQGNVMDMAVGSIIGLSFKDIVTIISPILGIFGGVDFSDMKWVIGTKEVTDATTGVTSVVENSINYGSFITGVINFVIMALIIFLMVKFLAALQGLGKKLAHKDEIVTEDAAVTEEVPAETSNETTEVLLKEIRDLLKSQAEKETAHK